MDRPGSNSYNKGMKKTAVVSEKGQVTIPKPLRRSLGLAPGTMLAFEERGGRLVASRVAGDNSMDALVGTGIASRTDAFLRQTRGARFEPRRDVGER